jgi:hypothetical protein
MIQKRKFYPRQVLQALARKSLESLNEAELHALKFFILRSRKYNIPISLIQSSSIRVESVADFEAQAAAVLENTTTRIFLKRSLPITQNAMITEDTTPALKAYQVGDYDIVAAYTPEGAIEILCENFGYPREDYTIDEVQLVSDKHLDSLEVFNVDEGKTETLQTSLRQDVAALNAPAYIYGWE